MKQTKFLCCTAPVNKNAVRRENIGGVEHVIVSSFTMPDNVVMNRILYPSSEIDSSYMGLNRTLAPLGHPTDTDGNFISASDPHAVHNFHAGAFNDKAQKVDSRIKVEKTINVQEAMKTDRGKRLLDRINELETNEEARPIHTSTGIFLELEEFESPQVNSAGQEFDAIAHNLIFDHDAILLDENGAATPEDGVGMAVNANGEKVGALVVNLTENFEAPGQPFDGNPNGVERVETVTEPARSLSMFNIAEQLANDAKTQISHEFLIVHDLFNDRVIIETDAGFFEAPYTVNGDKARLSGIPIRVERIVSYQPKVNAKAKDNAMRDMILNALKASNIEADGLTDDELLAAYNKTLEANAESEEESTDMLSEAIKPLTEKMEAIEATLNATNAAEKDGYIKAILNSENYPDMTEEDLSSLSADRLKALAANIGAGFGLPLTPNEVSGSVSEAPAEMPE